MRLADLVLSLALHAGAAGLVLLLALSGADPPPRPAQGIMLPASVVTLPSAGGVPRGAGGPRMRRPRPQPPSTATTAATNVASLASEATAGTDLAAPGGDDVLPLAGVPYGDDAAAGPPTPIRAAPVRAGGDIRPPVKLRHVPPVYPELARVARIEGHVVLECTIGPEGRIVEVTILSGPPLLRTAAAEAVRQWLYRPTLLDEVAVPVVMTVTVRFTLSR